MKDDLQIEARTLLPKAEKEYWLVLKDIERARELEVENSQYGII